MARYIEERKRAFNLRKLKIINAALSKEPGAATLSRQYIGDGSASLEPERASSESIRVKLETLDSLHTPNLKFIKCDVEGHELDVFSGGERTIKTHRPVVQFEAVPSKAIPLFSFFESIGYSGVMFLGDRYLPPSNPARVKHYKFGMDGHRDFLFFPPEAIGTTIPTSVSQQFPRWTGALVL